MLIQIHIQARGGAAPPAPASGPPAAAGSGRAAGGRLARAAAWMVWPLAALLRAAVSVIDTGSKVSVGLKLRAKISRQRSTDGCTECMQVQ